MTRSIQKKERSNFRAGLLTIIILVVGFSFTLGLIRRNANAVEGARYTLDFTMSDGVGTLQTGSLITAAGITVGQIDSLRIEKDTLKAEIFIKKPFALYPGAEIHRSDSMVGGAASLTISSFGDDSKPELKNGMEILSASKPPAIRGILGAKDASKIVEIQRNTDELTEGMQRISTSLRGENGIASFNEDFQSIMEQTSQDVEIWTPRLERIQNRIEAFQTQLPDMKLELDELTQKTELTEKTILELRETFGPERRRKLVDAVNLALEDAREISTRIDTQVLPQIKSIIDQANYSWSDFQSIQKLVQSMASDARRSLQVAVGNSALAAQQLLLAQSEIIDSLGIPLIEKPSLEDQRLEIKLDILQRWTRSAIQLRRFLGALEMLKGNSDNINDDDLLEHLLDSLRATLAEFEDAQSKLIEIQGSSDGEPGPDDEIDETDDQDR